MTKENKGLAATAMQIEDPRVLKTIIRMLLSGAAAEDIDLLLCCQNHGRHD